MDNAPSESNTRRRRRRRRRSRSGNGNGNGNGTQRDEAKGAAEAPPADESSSRRRAALPELFAMDSSFESLGLTDALLRAVGAQGYERPTIVQARLIPLALAGRDVLGQSKTGTGKTAAFGLPILQMTTPEDAFAALILVPTRELALQVSHELRDLAQFTRVRVATIYGGQKMRIQAEKLKKNPSVIVGTPGRVMDFHRRGHLPYDHIRIAVLDEVDRMLDIGFREDIRRILGTMQQAHQTIFVSATISEEIERLARRYMRDPERLIITTSRSLTVENVRQLYLDVQPWDKNKLLVHLLKHEEPALTLVFCRTKQTVDGLRDYLRRKHIDAHAIHGDMYQGERNRVMRKLRDGELSVLIASDLAARGLDVDDITHVINYDLPDDPEIYVHRIGRTARAGRDGIAWSFVTPGQGLMLSNIERLTNVEIPKMEYPDFVPGPEPPEVTAKREVEAEREEVRRIERSRVPTGPPAPEEAADATKYPGGVVPVSMPKRRIGGRVRRRRR